MGASTSTSILVRVPNWLGDAVMCEPALSDLRDRFPSGRIAILARPGIGELLSGHPALDEVIEYDWRGQHKGLMGFRNLIELISEKRFDKAVLFQNAFEAAFIAFGARIPERIGYATDGRGFLLTKRVPLPVSLRLHQVDYYQTLVSRAFSRLSSERLPVLYVSAVEERTVKARFSQVFPPQEGCLIGINPGSIYGSAKRWLPERFAAVGSLLIQEMKTLHAADRMVRCVILGGPGEEGLGRYIADRIQGETVVLSGQTSIRELMVVMKHCSLLLTNDTGPMHMAQALGVPVLAVFGPTDPETTGPRGTSHEVVRTPVRCSPCMLRSCPIDHRCMTGVSVEQVWKVGISQVRTPVRDDHSLKSPGN